MLTIYYIPSLSWVPLKKDPDEIFWKIYPTRSIQNTVQACTYPGTRHILEDPIVQ